MRVIEIEHPEVKWIPVAAAASVLKVSAKRIYQLIEENRLNNVVIAGTVLVSLRSVMERAERQNKQRGEKNANRFRV
jgi:hypothetical protein